MPYTKEIQLQLGGVKPENTNFYLQVNRESYLKFAYLICHSRRALNPHTFHNTQIQSLYVHNESIIQ